MPCLKCGGQSEAEALLCDSCAEASFQEPRFFLSPVLIGPSLFSRLRERGSAAYLLGPNAGTELVLVPSLDLERWIRDYDVQHLQHEDLKEFHARCDALLAHLGVPLSSDSWSIMLAEDAAEVITAIVQKVNLMEKMYPLEGKSDLYLRIGVVYSSAAHGILLRTTSKKWRETKQGYLVTRAKEYLSKVSTSDDLYSLAVRNLGMLCLDFEEWAQAEDNLANAYRHFPNDVRVGEGLARAHLMLGNEVEALEIVDEVMNQGERPELWVLKGRILGGMKRSEEAVECFNRALALDPRHMPAHDMLVEVLKQMGRSSDAELAENQRSLARRPDLDQKLSEVILEFRTPPLPAAGPRPPEPHAVPRVAKPGPGPVPDGLQLAREALQRKDYDRAIQICAEILRGMPDDREAQLIGIESLVEKGELAEAERRAHSFYEKNNDDPAGWYWRGVICGREEKWGAAVQYLSKAVTLDPKLVDGWVVMGEVLLSHGKQNGADESFSKALELDDANARAWLGKGKIMKSMGRWGAAIQCLDRYNMLMPNEMEAWLLKADLLLEKEKYNRAIEAYDKYLAGVPGDSYALGRKGVALNAIGREDEAKENFEESVRIDPTNKDAAKWLKALKGGG